MSAESKKKRATVYRLQTQKHLCPWGIKAKDLLKRNGYSVGDQTFRSKKEAEHFKESRGFDETPQIYIEDQSIGSYDALREYLGLGPDPDDGETYRPVIVVFIVSLAAASAINLLMGNTLTPFEFLRTFIALVMCLLGVQKLRDLRSFENAFIQYDQVAMRYVPYAAIYAYIETIGGILMLANRLTWLVAPVVFIASTVGAFSVIKAVYIEKRDLRCACVGGDQDVPLGALSLTENLTMLGLSGYMILTQLF